MSPTHGRPLHTEHVFLPVTSSPEHEHCSEPASDTAENHRPDHHALQAVSSRNGNGLVCFMRDPALTGASFDAFLISSTFFEERPVLADYKDYYAMHL